MSLGYIPFTAIAEYAKIYNIKDFEEFHYFIKIMDYKYVGLQDGNKTKKSDKD